MTAIEEADQSNLPEAITATLYLQQNIAHGYFYVSQFKPDEEFYTLIAEPMDVTFKIKDNDEIIKKVVENLRSQIQKTRADAEMKCNGLEEKIQSLLCLEAPEAKT